MSDWHANKSITDVMQWEDNHAMHMEQLSMASCFTMTKVLL